MAVDASDDFEAAKTVFSQLKDLPLERQQRVLRWVAEGLGLAISAGNPQPNPLVAPPSLPAVPPAATATGSGMDIKSFIAAKVPKSDQQFAAAVAYFYRFEAPTATRRDSIDSDALQEAARLAGRARLSKPLMTLNNAKKAGYLDSAGRGEFSVNSVGENLVAMALPGGADSAPRRPAKRGKKTGKGSKK